MMPCPKCYKKKGAVEGGTCIDSRISRRYSSFRRRRRYVCTSCGERFTTYEDLETNAKWDYDRKSKLDMEGVIALSSQGFAK